MGFVTRHSLAPEAFRVGIATEGVVRAASGHRAHDYTGCPVNSTGGPLSTFRRASGARRARSARLLRLPRVRLATSKIVP